MKKSEMLFGVLRLPLDAAAVLSALLFSYWLRINQIDLVPNVQLLEPAQSLPEPSSYLQNFVVPSIACILLLAAIFRLYALRTTLGAWQEVGRVLTVVLLWVVGVVGWYFLIERELFFSRMLLVHSAVFLSIFIVILRAVVVIIQRLLLRTGIGVHQVASVGTQPLSVAAKRTLQRDGRYRYRGHASSLQELSGLIEQGKPDLVLQTDPDPSSKVTMELIEHCRAQHIGYAFLPPVFADVPHQLRVERLGFVPMIRFCPTPLDGWGRVWKRIFDLTVSVVLIAVFSPVMLVAAIAVLLTSGWPIFYVSRRVGERTDREIPVVKFRSMVPDADARKIQLLQQNERSDGPLFKLSNDPRITPVGRILRRFDIDELPQLFNVLFGHMSLVGPRPHLPDEVDRYKLYERRVFAVRPGITGLAQISGRSTLKFQDEVRLDLQYIEEWSILLDIWILWRTLFVVIFRR